MPRPKVCKDTSLPLPFPAVIPAPPVIKKKRIPAAPRENIRVTKVHMDHSSVKSSSHCMIAMAVKDAIPMATSIAVDIQTIRFSLPEKRIRCTYLTPRIAQTAIIQYDQGVMPKPFEFKLSGAHVTSMYTRVRESTPRQRLTERQRAAIDKALANNPNNIEGKRRKRAKSVDVADHPELTGEPKLIDLGDGHLPMVAGGSPLKHPIPRVMAPGKRRAFGLRAMQI